MKQPSIVPLNPEKHSNLKVKQDTTLAASANQHLVALTMRECPSAASAMPIVFIKNPQSNSLHFAAIMGVDPEVNLYRQNEKWMGHHVPWNIQRHPFDIRGSAEQVNVFIDENSNLIDEKEGIAIFNSEGKTTDYFEHIQKLLAAIAESELTSQSLFKIITEYELIQPIQIHVNYESGEQKNLVGMFGINEAKLNALPDDKILSLMKSGALGVLYAVLTSVGQLNRIIELSKTSDKPIKALQVGADTKATETATEAKEEKPKAKKITRKKVADK